MEKIDIVLWAMAGGFSIIFGLLLVVWTTLWKAIGKLDEKVTDIDRRLCRLEGAFSAKDCCMLTTNREFKKAE